MKKFSLSLLVVTILALAVSSCAFGSVTGAPAPAGQKPMLLTNAGQGPGGKMGRLLIRRAKAIDDFTYNAEPKPEDLVAGGFKTMIVVIGSSAKGLGASGITIDQEIERLDAMMAKAKELGIQIIAAHIEGKARRGKPGSADERSIDAIIPLADPEWCSIHTVLDEKRFWEIIGKLKEMGAQGILVTPIEKMIL